MYSVHFLQPPPTLFWAYVEPAARFHLALSLSFSLLAFFFVCIFFIFLEVYLISPISLIRWMHLQIRRCFYRRTLAYVMLWGLVSPLMSISNSHIIIFLHLQKVVLCSGCVITSCFSKASTHCTRSGNQNWVTDQNWCVLFLMQVRTEALFVAAWTLSLGCVRFVEVLQCSSQQSPIDCVQWIMEQKGLNSSTGSKWTFSSPNDPVKNSPLTSNQRASTAGMG